MKQRFIALTFLATSAATSAAYADGSKSLKEMTVDEKITECTELMDEQIAELEKKGINIDKDDPSNAPMLLEEHDKCFLDNQNPDLTGRFITPI